MGVSVQGQGSMKYNNLTAVFHIINDAGPISRADIAKIAGMSPTSITRLSSDLASVGLISEMVSTIRKVGRTATLLTVNPAFAYTVSVNIDSDFVHVSLFDFCRNLIGLSKFRLRNIPVSPETVIDRVYGLYQKLLKEYHISDDAVIGVGISAVGAINDDRVLAFSPQMHWENIDICTLFRSKFRKELVILENDCNSAVLGECIKNPDYRKKTVALISLCSGVGSSVCVGGELLNQGSNYTLSELGHTTVDPNGLLCNCGRRGCLQTFIAEKYLVQRAAENDPKISSAIQFASAWRVGELWAKKLMEDTFCYIQIAINTLACMYQPNIILLGGSMIDEYADLFSGVEDCQDMLFKTLQGGITVQQFHDMVQSSMIGVASRVQSLYLNQVLKKLANIL